MKIAVIGGGIGGLATSIALAKRGHMVDVFERAAEFTEVGAGLQISPNGTKILNALGVDLEIAVVAPNITMLNGYSGRHVFTIPLGAATQSRWGASYLHMHRADLHGALVAQVGDTDAIRIHLNAEIGAGSIETEYNLVVGADGVHSNMRSTMFGELEAEYTGYTAWRGTFAVNEFAPPMGATVWAGHKIHAVTTRIRGGDLVNLVGIVADEWRDEGWHIEGDQLELQNAFADFEPNLTQILPHLQDVKKWALLTRDPLPKFHRDKYVLVGDAAHPMLPTGAQGAVMALEDAWVLAACLERGVEEGLRVYSNTRAPRAAKVQKFARSNLAHFHRSPALAKIEHIGASMVSRFAPSMLMSRQDWLYGHDVVSKWPSK